MSISVRTWHAICKQHRSMQKRQVPFRMDLPLLSTSEILSLLFCKASFL